MESPVPVLNLLPRSHSHLRTASRSSTRSPVRQRMSITDDILSDLSPETTLEAFTNPSGKLRASVEAATPFERAFGIRATTAGKKIKEWLDELSQWPWPRGSNGFETPPYAKRQKLDGSGADNEGTGEVEYVGSLPEQDVLDYEIRIEDILDDMEDLDVDEIKSTVLNTHFSPVSRPSSSASSAAPMPTSLSGYTRMDDLTAVVTATVLQALPNLARLTRLLDVWSVRLTILRRIEPLLSLLADAEVALKSGWQAIGLHDDSTCSTDERELSDLDRSTFEVMRNVLQDKVTTLGKELDFMLDTLEGREETIPDTWLDRMEAIEADYGEWAVCGDRRVREGEWARMAKLKLEQEEERKRAKEERWRILQEEEARLKAEEERLEAFAEADRAQRMEEEARLRAEADRLNTLSEAKRARKEEEENLRAEEERLRALVEAEKARKEEEDRLRAEEEQRRARAEQERAEREAAERLLAVEEQRRILAEADRAREEEEKRLRAEKARLKAQAERERAQKEEEARVKAEEEQSRLLAEAERAKIEEAERLEAQAELELAARLRQQQEEERLSKEALARAEAELVERQRIEEEQRLAQAEAVRVAEKAQSEERARLQAEAETSRRLEEEREDKQAQEEARVAAMQLAKEQEKSSLALQDAQVPEQVQFQLDEGAHLETHEVVPTALEPKRPTTHGESSASTDQAIETRATAIPQQLAPPEVHDGNDAMEAQQTSQALPLRNEESKDTRIKTEESPVERETLPGVTPYSGAGGQTTERAEPSAEITTSQNMPELPLDSELDEVAQLTHVEQLPRSPVHETRTPVVEQSPNAHRSLPLLASPEIEAGLNLPDCCVEDQSPIEDLSREQRLRSRSPVALVIGAATGLASALAFSPRDDAALSTDHDPPISKYAPFDGRRDSINDPSSPPSARHFDHEIASVLGPSPKNINDATSTSSANFNEHLQDNTSSKSEASQSQNLKVLEHSHSPSTPEKSFANHAPVSGHQPIIGQPKHDLGSSESEIIIPHMPSAVVRDTVLPSALASDGLVDEEEDPGQYIPLHKEDSQPSSKSWGHDVQSSSTDSQQPSYESPIISHKSAVESNLATYKISNRATLAAEAVEYSPREQLPDNSLVSQKQPSTPTRMFVARDPVSELSKLETPSSASSILKHTPKFTNNELVDTPDHLDFSGDGAQSSTMRKFSVHELNEVPGPSLARRTSIAVINSGIKKIDVSRRGSMASDTSAMLGKQIGMSSPVIPSSPISPSNAIADAESPSAGRTGFRNAALYDQSPPESPSQNPSMARRPSQLSLNFQPASPVNGPQTPISDIPLFPSLEVSSAPFTSPKHHNSSGDQLQAQIYSLLESIPARIRLTSEPPDLMPGPPLPQPNQSEGLKVRKPRRSLTPSIRSSSAMSSRAPTPSFTLAPAYGKGQSRHRPSNSEIKLYHLSRSTGEAPIKLFVRLVGENGERVMVRVGGGWADLGEYLREYASHHGRRSASSADDKVEIQDLTSRIASTGSTTSTATIRGMPTGRSSPVTRPNSVLERERPVSSLYVRKTRKSIGEESVSTTHNIRHPSTPLPNAYPSVINSFNPSTPPSGTSDRSSSRMSWMEEEPGLGLAGPNSKAKVISERDEQWVESMKEKVRQASVEKEKAQKAPPRKSFGELEKAGATKRLFRKGKN